LLQSHRWAGKRTDGVAISLAIAALGAEYNHNKSKPNH
jgi:hypothetical protein